MTSALVLGGHRAKKLRDTALIRTVGSDSDKTGFIDGLLGVTCLAQTTISDVKSPLCVPDQ
jgi:hypothetical protein